MPPPAPSTTRHEESVASDLRRAGAYGRDQAAFLRWNQEALTLVVMIEHIDAVANIRDILAVPGVSSVFIGPNDLSASMGLLGNPEHPDVVAAVKGVIDECSAAGVAVGCGTYTGRAAHDLIRMGVDYLVGGGDLWLMQESFAKASTDLREASRAVESPIGSRV